MTLIEDNYTSLSAKLYTTHTHNTKHMTHNIHTIHNTHNKHQPSNSTHTTRTTHTHNTQHTPHTHTTRTTHTQHTLHVQHTYTQHTHHTHNTHHTHTTHTLTHNTHSPPSVASSLRAAIKSPEIPSENTQNTPPKRTLSTDAIFTALTLWVKGTKGSINYKINCNYCEYRVTERHKKRFIYCRKSENCKIYPKFCLSKSRTRRLEITDLGRNKSYFSSSLKLTNP